MPSEFRDYYNYNNYEQYYYNTQHIGHHAQPRQRKRPTCSEPIVIGQDQIKVQKPPHSRSVYTCSAADACIILRVLQNGLNEGLTIIIGEQPHVYAYSIRLYQYNNDAYSYMSAATSCKC